MKTESTVPVARGARSQYSMRDDSPDRVVSKPIPPSDRLPIKQPEAPEELARALRIAATRSDRISPRIVALLAALVITCCVMAVVVWWRLLT